MIQAVYFQTLWGILALVAQLQAHLATLERRIKYGQRSALTHNLFPLALVVTP